MSKKPVTMSVARPSRAIPKEETPAPVIAVAPSENIVESSSTIAAPASTPVIQAQPPQPAPVPRLRMGNTARLEQGVKRIVVDVTPSVHKQVKVKSIDYPGGIKEYILRLLEADGLDLSSQPDFVPRPK
jgi:hypothetical protein